MCWHAIVALCRLTASFKSTQFFRLSNFFQFFDPPSLSPLIDSSVENEVEISLWQICHNHLKISLWQICHNHSNTSNRSLWHICHNRDHLIKNCWPHELGQICHNSYTMNCVLCMWHNVPQIIHLLDATINIFATLRSCGIFATTKVFFHILVVDMPQSGYSVSRKKLEEDFFSLCLKNWVLLKLAT